MDAFASKENDFYKCDNIKSYEKQFFFSVLTPALRKKDLVTCGAGNVTLEERAFQSWLEDLLILPLLVFQEV